MFSRKNRKMLIMKTEKRILRYSIKKLSVGVASVLVGTAILFGSGTLANAAENEGNVNNSEDIVVFSDRNQSSDSSNLTPTQVASRDNVNQEENLSDASSTSQTTSENVTGVVEDDSKNNSALHTDVNDSSQTYPEKLDTEVKDVGENQDNTMSNKNEFSESIVESTSSNNLEESLNHSESGASKENGVSEEMTNETPKTEVQGINSQELQKENSPINDVNGIREEVSQKDQTRDSSGEVETIALNTKANIIKTDNKQIDDTTHYTASGVEDSSLTYGKVVYSGLDKDGNITLTLTKWAKSAGGWGESRDNPYAGKIILSFHRKEFYDQIESITIQSNSNNTAFEKMAEGAMWTIPINVKTVQSGLLGVVSNHLITIKLKDVNSLNGMQDDTFSFSTVWIKGNGKIAAEGISNGFIQINNAHIGKTEDELVSNRFIGTNSSGQMTNTVLIDGKNNLINSVHTFKPANNFLTFDYNQLIYILEQIPKELLPFIDTDNILIGSSDVNGNFLNNITPIKLKVDKNGLVDSRNTPEISIIQSDTKEQLASARNTLDKNVFYGTLGRFRSYTIKYQLKAGVSLADFSRELNQYIKKNDKQMLFESWMEQDFLNNSNRPLIDQPDHGKATKEFAKSYANGFIEASDTDKDGLFDFVEFELGSDINKVDTDGDGVPDAQEVLIDKTDATNSSSYLVSAPAITVTTVSPTMDSTISGTVSKITYEDPSDPSKTLKPISEGAGNVIVQLIDKKSGSVVAETTIPFNNLGTGQFELTVKANTVKSGDQLQLLTLSPDRKHSTEGSVIRAISQADQYSNSISGKSMVLGLHASLPEPAEMVTVYSPTTLPEGTTMSWSNDLLVDTNVAGNHTQNINIMYPDGSIGVVSTRFTIQNLIPEVIGEEVPYGGVINLLDNIKNISNLVKGTAIRDITTTKIDTTQLGNYQGKIEITYPNGFKEVVNVPVTVVKSEALKQAEAAVKAAEAAGQAGADKKAEVETDGLVTPDEKAAVDGLNNTTTEKKEAASQLVDALPEGPEKAALTDRLNKVTTSEVTVNDANSNGKDDAQEQAEAEALKQAEAAVKAAEAAGQAGADKKAEVETDGLVTPDEKAAVDGLNNTTTEKKEAASQASILPIDKLLSIGNNYSQFPKTGEKIDYILTIYGGLLLLGSLGLLVFKRRKNEDRE